MNNAKRINANVKAAWADIADRVGLALGAAAATFVAEHQERLNVSNPRPHVTPAKRGEYPRKRTGFGQANVLYSPTSPAEIAKAGHVDAGYTANAGYMQALAGRGWKGVEDTLTDLRAKLQGIVDRVMAGGGNGGSAAGSKA